MSTLFTPKVGERMQPVEMAPPSVRAILNLPEGGTPIRATIGQTTIIGWVYPPNGIVNPSYIPVGIPTPSYYEHLVHLYIEGGWQFEILEESEYLESLAQFDEKWRTFWGRKDSRGRRGQGE